MDVLSIKANLDVFELEEEASDAKLISISGKEMLWTLTLRKTSFPGSSKGFFDVLLQANCRKNANWSAKVNVVSEVICDGGSYKIRCIDLKTSYTQTSYMAHALMPDEVNGQIEFQVGIELIELLLGTAEERLRAELWTTKSVVMIVGVACIGVACIASTASLVAYKKFFEM
uniref:Uncharacterized protein n=1 Tax=Ditylenchus dipsaci TaxID=166011 RepID=A0A915EDB7_9BILA